MNPIEDLDLALKRRGADIVLRRMTVPPTDLTVRASSRFYLPEEIAGGVVAGDIRVVISPTGLDDAAWVAAFSATGGQSMDAPFDVDSKWPKRGDKIIIENRLRSIEAVYPFRVGDDVVRIEMQAR